MSIIDAFMAHSNTDLICKWALEFGHSGLLKALAKKHPEKLIESAIDLGHVSWMLDLVHRYGIGFMQIQQHILNKGTVDQVLELTKDSMVNLDAAKQRFIEMALARGEAADQMMSLVHRGPQKLLEEVLVSIGDERVIATLAKLKWCKLAEETMIGLRACEHVMTS